MVLPPLELFSLRKELPCCRAALSVFGHFFGISRIIEPLCRVTDVKRPTADRGPLYYWMEIWCVLCGRRIFSTHSVTVADAPGDDVARVKIHRDVDDCRVRRGQVSERGDRSDIACHLSDADVEAEVRLFSLGKAHGVVEGRGYIRLAGGEGNAGRRVRAEILDGRRLLSESHRGNGYDSVRDWQGNAEPAEYAANEAVALSAEAKEGGIGGLPAEVRQEGDG